MKERYFSHDANARSDPKIVKIRRRYGMEGYGIYFALLEMMFGETDHALPCNDSQFDAIAYDLHTDVNIGEFVADCIEAGLFRAEGDRFYSESFRRRLEETAARAEERSRRAAEASMARWGRRTDTGKAPAQNPPETPSGPSENDAEWARFAQAYETQLGSLPHGRLLEKLMSYYDDMGADMLIEAVQATNEAEADKPASFLLAVLKGWADAGIDSVEKAKAQIIDHKRAAKRRNPPAAATGNENNIPFVY